MAGLKVRNAIFSSGPVHPRLAFQKKKDVDHRRSVAHDSEEDGALAEVVESVACRSAGKWRIAPR